jgi:hypothetical protein
MFYLYAELFKNVGVQLGLELYHRRRISRDCVGCPYIRSDDPMERPPKLFDCSETGGAILPVTE